MLAFQDAYHGRTLLAASLTCLVTLIAAAAAACCAPRPVKDPGKIKPMTSIQP